MTGPDHDRRDVSLARRIGGLALIGVVGILAVIDAASVDYSLDSIVLGLLLGTGTILLGAEAGLKYLRGPD